MSVFSAPRLKKRRSAHVNVTVTITIMAATVTAASPAMAAPPTMGVFLTHGDEAAIQRYETWTNQSMAPIIDFGPDDNWEALTGVTSGYGMNWSCGQWDAATKNRVIWSMPMLPKTGNITTNAG